MKNIILLLSVVVAVSCKGVATNEYESQFDQKKELLLRQVADQYTPPALSIGDPEKYVWPKVIARFELYGTQDSLANFYLEALKDRSPFHFTLVGMARIMSKYEDAPFIQQNKKHLLQKVFDRTDSYNAWTSEGTENHNNMTRPSGYIFAQHALDFPDDFPDAKEKLAMMKEWMQWWSKQMFATGTGEWNSSIYMAYNIIGWLNVYDFARDPEVRDMAKAVLDAYAVEMALHNSWGLLGGSEMRGVGANMDGRSSTAYCNWVWFSDQLQAVNGFGGSQYIQAVHAVTSSYRPNALITRFATQKPEIPAYYKGSKPSYCFEEASFVKQTYYVDENFTMGNGISNYGGFTGASYQMVPWKIVLRDSLPMVISGNGSFFNDRSGKTRNPFTQSVQHKNVLMQITRVPSDVQDVIKSVDSVMVAWSEKTLHDLKIRFPDETYKFEGQLVNAPKERNLRNQAYITLPKTESFEKIPNGYLFHFDHVAILVISLHPENDTIYHTNTRTFIETSVGPDQLCGFVLEVLDAETQLSGLEFIVNTSGNKISYESFSGDLIDMEYTLAGQYIEPMVDWGFGPTEPVLYPTSPPFFQPQWPACFSCGRVPTYSVNQKQVDVSADWPMYSGPGLVWENGIMQLSVDGKTYRIDYSGSRPVYGN
jgi:hypothetical protein